MMRILHFISAFPQLTQTFIMRYVEKSTEFGETAVMSFKVHEVPEHMGHKIAVYHLQKNYCRKSIAGAAGYIKYKATGVHQWHRQVNQIIDELHPDIVHCHFGEMGVCFAKYLQKTKRHIPFVTTFYGVDASARPWRNRKYYDDLQNLWTTDSRFLVEGPALGKKLTALHAPQEKIVVNPLLIPIQEYAPKQNYRKPEEPVRFLLIGRYVEKKGFHLFLEALGSIKEQLPDFTVSMIGNGDLEAQYRSTIQKYGYTDRVHFLGWQSHKEVIAHLRNHDFFVHPSITAQDGDSEGGAPTILLEAQAVGIPVITSDHADIPFIMGYHDFLCKENNIKDLAQVMLKAVQYTDWEKLVQKGRHKVKDQHHYQTNSTYFQALSALASSKKSLSFIAEKYQDISVCAISR